MMTARRWIVAYGLAGSAMLCSPAFAAPAWPERPIRIVVPLPAGTSPDLFARHFGQKLAVRLRQPVIIENRPGANSVIGTAVVAKASADGYTLLNASVQHVMLKPLLGKLPFDPDADFVAVSTLSATEMILVVPAASRFTAVTELVAAAKTKPGELNFATPASAVRRISRDRRFYLPPARPRATSR